MEEGDRSATDNPDILMEVVRHVRHHELQRLRVSSKALRTAVAAGTQTVEWHADARSLPAKLAAFPHASSWHITIPATSRQHLYTSALSQLSAAASPSLRSRIKQLALIAHSINATALDVEHMATRFTKLEELALTGCFEAAVYDMLYAQLPGPLGTQLTQLHISTDAGTGGAAAGGRWVLRPADLQAVAACCTRLQRLTLTWPNLEDDPVTPWCEGLQALGRLAQLQQLSLTSAPLCHLPQFASALASALASLAALTSLSLGIAECAHAHEGGSAAVWEGGQEEYGCGVWVGVWGCARGLRALELRTDEITQALYDDLVGLTLLSSLRVSHTTWALDFSLTPSAGPLVLPGLRELGLPVGDAQLGTLVEMAPHLTALSLSLKGLTYNDSLGSDSSAHGAAAGGSAAQLGTCTSAVDTHAPTTATAAAAHVDVGGASAAHVVHSSNLSSMPPAVGASGARHPMLSPTTYSTPAEQASCSPTLPPLAHLLQELPCLSTGAPLAVLSALSGLRSFTCNSRHIGLSQQVAAAWAAGWPHLSHLSFTGSIAMDAPAALTPLTCLKSLSLCNVNALERGVTSGSSSAIQHPALRLPDLPVLDLCRLPSTLQQLQLARVQVVASQPGASKQQAPGNDQLPVGQTLEDQQRDSGCDGGVSGRALPGLESLQLEGCSLACGLEHHVAAPLTRLVLSSCTTPPDVVPPVRGPDALRTLVRAAPFLHTLHMIGPAGSACGLHGVAGLDGQELRELCVSLRTVAPSDLDTLCSLTQLRTLVLETGSMDGLQRLSVLTRLRHLSVTINPAFDPSLRFNSGMGRAVVREQLRSSLLQGLPHTDIVCAVR